MTIVQIEASAEAIIRRLEEAFAPHRAFITVSDDQHLDFEVMALDGAPVVALTPSPLALFTDPAALAILIAEARQIGRERGHAFDAP